MNNKIVLFILSLILISCQVKKSNINNKEKLLIHFKDYAKDTIFGLSLYKLEKEKIKFKSDNSIIVAVLDSQIDLNHEDLQGQLWVNKKEIPNNNIDDDNNGYIDDVNGWNFVGKPNGGYFRYWNFEYTRLVANKNNVNTSEYNRAKLKLDNLIDTYQNAIEADNVLIENYDKIHDTLLHFFPKNDYNQVKVDSLFKLLKINDDDLKTKIKNKDSDVASLLYYKLSLYDFGNESKESLQLEKNQYDSILNRNLNSEYNDRILIGDNPMKLEKGYGNNVLNNNIYQLYHNTSVSSIISANKINNIGTEGFHQDIKIMPLSISVSGDEHDKDIAMAIYYAVDNGAKIINMSFGKEFSLKQEWVTEAFKYAEKHNVLIIHSSGNNGIDIDKNPYYPTDIDYKNSTNEMVSNFINVGSISSRTDSTFVSRFSNYGKNNVDIFAPGEKIYVAKPNNKYGYDSGTSLAAPMVSGTAALIWLYYPNLSVQEVKQIILESGVIIDKKVIKPGTKDELVPFSELCKSGKILNTYNAMQMAKQMSKKKK